MEQNVGGFDRTARLLAGPLLLLVGGPFSLLYLWPLLSDADQRPTISAFTWDEERIPWTKRSFVVAVVGGALLLMAVAAAGVSFDGIFALVVGAVFSPIVVSLFTTDGSIDDDRLAPVILFILAITLHNMPEGLAVGVGFGSAAAGDTSIGSAVALMLAIGIQNVPEGLAVSIAAVNAGLDRRFYAAITGVRSGLVEIPLVLVGALAVTLAAPILPYAMGFAAGAMLFVISDEIVPETHLRGNERVATLGTIVGVVVMLYLDISLG